GPAPVRVQEQTKAPVEGRLAAMGMVLQGADIVGGLGMARAVEATENSSGLNLFGVLSGSMTRYETGSHVDVDGLSLMAGVARQATNSVGDFTGAWFVEGGWGNYSTHNRFDGNHKVRGSGKTDYVGTGL